MNKHIINAVIAVLLMVIALPIKVISQEKKVRVKTVTVLDGEKVVKDTTFTVIEGEDEGEIIKTFTWTSIDDSAGTIIYDIDIDVDIDEDYEKGEYKKVIILKSDDDEGVMLSHGGREHKYVIKIDESEDGKEDIYFINEDIDFDIDEEELKNIRIELDGEKILILEGLEHLEEYEHLKAFEELENMEVNIPQYHRFPEHNEHVLYMHHGYDIVSDKELRDAGIKNKPVRLEIENYNINIDDGVVDLEFKLKEEGTPKVIVFNYFGDKVFTGKPELMNDNFVIKMDLSKKQYGTYYLQILLKDSSNTKKLKL